MIRKEQFLEEVENDEALEMNARLQALKLRAKLFLIENATHAFAGAEIIGGVKQWYRTQRREEIVLRRKKEELARIEEEERKKSTKAKKTELIEKMKRVDEAIAKQTSEINEEVAAKVKEDVPFHEGELPYPVVRYLRKREYTQYGTVQYADVRLINEGGTLRQYFMWVEEPVEKEAEKENENENENEKKKEKES